MGKRKGSKIGVTGKYRNIKAELQREGVTQKQVADHFKISMNNFNMKVNGKVPFTVQEIVAIRDEFMPDATLDYLLWLDPDDVASEEKKQEKKPEEASA